MDKQSKRRLYYAKTQTGTWHIIIHKSKVTSQGPRATVAKRDGTVYTGSKAVHMFGTVHTGVLFSGIRYCSLAGGTVHRDPLLWLTLLTL
jgi:hypothetical protein